MARMPNLVMNDPALVNMKSDKSVLIRSHRRQRLVKLFCVSAATIMIAITMMAYRKYQAIGVLRNSGFVMATGLNGPDWLRRSVYPEWIRKLEGSGWLPGLHIVARVGPPPRPVTREALQALVQLQCVESLWIHDCGLRDEDLASVAQLQAVNVLDIRDNPITDEGLGSLTVLGSLQFLNVRGTDVTAAGVDRFRKAMPQCAVVSDL